MTQKKAKPKTITDKHKDYYKSLRRRPSPLPPTPKKSESLPGQLELFDKAPEVDTTSPEDE